VINVGTLAKIRRMHLRDGLPIKEIERRTGLARNTIKAWLRKGEMVEPKYPQRVNQTKLDGYTETLATWLKADLHRGKRDRRTIKALYEGLVEQGYTGGYGRVAAFARRWRAEQSGKVGKGAFVPLKFALGDAFQFDWSTEYAWVGGLRRRLEVAHTKLCGSRAFWLVAYPSQSHEMLFDAHARAFAAFGGVPQRGIYDNMKTAVDKVGAGKKRAVNARFEAMTGHYLFEPEFCNVASGWEKGIVEKNVRDRRISIWHKATKQRWPNMQALNTWLEGECRAAWAELNHPEWPTLKVADVLQDEQQRLMPNPRPFDGYIEVLARVSSTALVHLQRNRYSVPTEHAHEVVSLRLYPERIDVVAENARIASHARSFERSQTFYDWRHYVSLIERKPGALAQRRALRDPARAAEEAAGHPAAPRGRRPGDGPGAGGRAGARSGAGAGGRRAGARERQTQRRARAQRARTPEGWQPGRGGGGQNAADADGAAAGQRAALRPASLGGWRR
jgi:transposase